MFDPAKLTVLVVDDEPLVHAAVSACLEPLGHSIVSVATAEEAERLVARRRFDLILLDMRLHDHSGLDVLPELIEADGASQVVLMTGFASVSTAVEAMRRGAFDYITKPLSPAELEVLTIRVAERRRLARRILTLENHDEDLAAIPVLTSEYPAMSKVLATARAVAPTDATVLLTGESGTGKGVLARAIHEWSQRASGAFAVVNCPALSTELLNSEMFGHVKGAFTGAVQTKVGKVEYASGGTLFLDEVGELSPQIQPRLLRLLQEHDYERLGDPAPRQADVRVIAATNADLRKLVREGQFREDLFYRLDVIHLELAPLRERREDIGPMAQSILATLATRHGRPDLAFTPEALDHLGSLPWPGNIREMQNAIERAVILTRGSQLGVRALPRDGTGAAGPLAAIGDELVTLKEMEARYLRHVIDRTGSIEEAAKVLDVAPSTLWRRRRKYDI